MPAAISARSRSLLGGWPRRVSRPDSQMILARRALFLRQEVLSSCVIFILMRIARLFRLVCEAAESRHGSLRVMSCLRGVAITPATHVAFRHGEASEGFGITVRSALAITKIGGSRYSPQIRVGRRSGELMRGSRCRPCPEDCATTILRAAVGQVCGHNLTFIGLRALGVLITVWL